jgi:hypothetical protein
VASALDDPLLDLLADLADLLAGCGQRPWATRLAALATDLESAGNGPARADVVRSVLSLYGGMGSFSDVVLQDMSGALPEQDRLDWLRDRLFEQARGELR